MKINLNIFTYKTRQLVADYISEELFDDQDNDDWDDDENDEPASDVCPFCGSEMTPGNQYGMCNGCRRDRQGYADDRS